MGLDMYLEKRIYVKTWDYMPEHQRYQTLLMYGGMPVNSQLKITYVILEAAYWRKANQIHRWFVEHCAKGIDDCREVWVDRAQLEELLKICRQIKEDPDLGPILLPSQEGFFFGNTEYNKDYLDDIELTIKQLEIALADKLQGDFYYQASW